MKKTARPAPDKPATLREKLVLTLICLLFGVAFGAGGAFGVYGIGHNLVAWFETRGWQPVMVDVKEASLDSGRSRKSTTYQVKARYDYAVDGRPYSGTRVGLNFAMSDNIGDWQAERHAELVEAQRNGRLVLAWVDPKNPANAVIDRDLRWGLLLFFLPFAVLFSGVSLGALWGMVLLWFKG